MRIDEIRPTPNPRRVLVTDSRAVPAAEARNVYEIEPDIVFVRNDGWQLGAPEYLEDHAFDRWDDWVAFYRLRDMRVRPIEDF